MVEFLEPTPEEIKTWRRETVIRVLRGKNPLPPLITEAEAGHLGWTAKQYQEWIRQVTIAARSGEEKFIPTPEQFSRENHIAPPIIERPSRRGRARAAVIDMAAWRQYRRGGDTS